MRTLVSMKDSTPIRRFPVEGVVGNEARIGRLAHATQLGDRLPRPVLVARHLLKMQPHKRVDRRVPLGGDHADLLQHLLVNGKSDVLHFNTLPQETHSICVTVFSRNNPMRSGDTDNSAAKAQESAQTVTSPSPHLRS